LEHINFDNESVLEGETSNWQLLGLEHPDTVVLNYSAFLADGSALPEWLTFDANTLTFSGTPSFEEASVLAIKVVATDVNGLSAEQVFSLDVIDVNRLLELTGTPSLLMSGTEDTLYTLSASDLLQGYTDADGDSLNIINLQADSGVLADNQNGTYTFTPDANFNGTINLAYQVSDGRGGVIEATNSFVVEAVNDIPVVSNAFGEMSEDDVNVTGGVASHDVDGDALSYHLLGDAPEGVSFNNGAFTVTPLASDQALGQGQTRVVTFQYVANDGQADSLPATVQITINGVNDAPILTEASAILTDGQENATYTVTTAQLLQGFTDADGDLLNIANVSANHGTVTDNGNGTLTITPTANYNGSISLSYQVTDGKGGSVDATQSFNLIKAVNVDTVGTTGGDMLHGGSGDDTFIVNHVRDVVIEADTMVVLIPYNPHLAIT
jgi:VCBS repeat-containing protein